MNTEKRLIIETFEEAVQNDDESPRQKEAHLLRIWGDATEAQRAMIDDLLITLCGWGFKSLKKMTDELNREGN